MPYHLLSVLPVSTICVVKPEVWVQVPLPVFPFYPFSFLLLCPSFCLKHEDMLSLRRECVTLIGIPL